MTVDTDVSVVGAGPTGLTVALQLRSMGASVRIIERRNGPREWAPALAVHSRTLEVLRILGVADELMAEGVSDADLTIHFEESTVSGRLHGLDLFDTEYPLILFVPQPDVEAVLRERLSGLGVEVEWGTRFRSLWQDDQHVSIGADGPSGEVKISSRFVVGCDGAESSVRAALGIPFRGRRYRETIVVADVATAVGYEAGCAHAFMRKEGILFLFPLGSGRSRLIAPLGEEDAAGLDVMRLVREQTRGSVEVSDVSWVRAIKPQHRLAASYRSGRAFLAGDAAHVHSPAGAQGMNTGIQDAVNLGWKLAFACDGTPDGLIDTYESERRPVARQVVALTGLAFALEVSGFPPLRLGRRWAARPVASVILPRPRLVSRVARVVSGLDTRYRSGALGGGGSIRMRPGARLPDYLLRDAPVPRLHQLIDRPAFHLFVDDAFTADFESVGLPGHPLRVHRLESGWLPRAARPLCRRVLIRPDGYIAATDDDEDATDVQDFLQTWTGVGPDGVGAPASRPGRLSPSLPTQ